MAAEQAAVVAEIQNKHGRAAAYRYYRKGDRKP